MEKIDGLVLTFVLNALWQAPAALAAGLLGDRLLRRAPARQRHALWLAVAAACLLLPAAGLLQGEPTSSNAASPAPAVPDAAGWLAWVPAGPSREATVPAAAAPLALGLYALSLLIHGMGLARSWLRARRLVQSAHPLEVPERLAPAVTRCQAALGPVPVLGSPGLDGPVTVGARRPVILLPSGFFAAASPEETVAALGHEMAHVRRRDYALHLLAEALLFPIAFHPAVRLVRRRLAEAREMACDEAALETLIGRRAYARSLLSLAAVAAGLPRPSYTLGVLDAHTLEVRMKRILDSSPRLGARRARATLGAALLLLAGLGLAAWPLSVQAVPAVAAQGDLRPFAGTWTGHWSPDKDQPGESLPALTLEVRPDGVIVETWYRYQKGKAAPEKVSHPVVGYTVDGETLSLKVRIDDFAFGGQRPAVAMIEESLELTAEGKGVFRVLSNSYFLDAKQRGQSVPPPPPPIPMTRQR